jgi:hypothetical protein
VATSLDTGGEHTDACACSVDRQQAAEVQKKRAQVSLCDVDVGEEELHPQTGSVCRGTSLLHSALTPCRVCRTPRSHTPTRKVGGAPLTFGGVGRRVHLRDRCYVAGVERLIERLVEHVLRRLDRCICQHAIDDMHACMHGGNFG